MYSPGRQLVEDLRQSRVALVALRHNWLIGRPGDRQAGVVPRNPALGRRIVVAINLVDDVDDLAQGAEAMGEPDWHVELQVPLVVELERLPLPKGRRAASDVDHHVPCAAPGHTDQLQLSGMGLKVEAAQRSSNRSRVVVL